MGNGPSTVDSGGQASAGQQGEALDAFVAAVTARGLEVPAMMLLETARPFHLLIQQAFFLTHPLLRPWLGDRPLLWAHMLEDGDLLDRVLDLLACSRVGRGTRAEPPASVSGEG